MNMRKMLLKAIIIAGVVLISNDAFAHAKLVASSPAANAAVAQPDVITLTFNEPLVAAFSSFELTMSDGMKMPVKITISDDMKTLSGTPQDKVPPGEYIVIWHAATQDDGHRMEGTLSFISE